MAKRFTDTNKYKKPFFRAIPGAYKLLWDFLYHDCDHSGVWIVDFEIAQTYLGKDMPVNAKHAIDYFNGEGETRVIELDGGKKWFIPSFVEFQYGQLSEKNRAHMAVIIQLRKYNLLNDDLSIKKNKGVISPFEGAKDKEQDKDKEMEKDKEKDRSTDDEKLSEYEDWTSQIIDGNDQYFEQMFMKEAIPPSDNIQHWILDHRDLLNRYPKMRPPTQDAFRKSCIKHIRENFKKPINGTGTNGKTKTGVTAEGTRDRLNSYT